MNPDVILTPDQVPLNKIDYAFLNEPTKAIIRQLLTAKSKKTLGVIRGTFSGKVSIPQAELTMDYQMLLSQGEQEWEKIMEKIDQRLERMSPSNVLKTNAELAQSLNDINKFVPLGIYHI
jgi:transglutaminase/protease-like cytokinesis protein 3